MRRSQPLTPRAVGAFVAAIAVSVAVAGCGSQYSASQILAAQDARNVPVGQTSGTLGGQDAGGQTATGGTAGTGDAAGSPAAGSLTGDASGDTGAAGTGSGDTTAAGGAPAAGTVAPGAATGPVSSGAGGATTPGAAVKGSTPAPGTATGTTKPGTTTTPAKGTATTKASAQPSAAPSKGAAAPAAAAAGAPCTAQGAPLVVGQVGAWSGLVGQSAGNGRTGLAVWANYINSQGGLACHPVKVYSDDDQSSGSTSSSDVNDLVQNKHAQVFVGSFVPIDSPAYRSAVESNKVPTIGGDYVSQDWLQSPYMYPVGGSPEAAYVASLKGAAALGKTKIAIIYCVEASACSYGDSITKTDAPKIGSQIVYETSVSLTQSDFTSQCSNAMGQGATMIFYFGDGSSVQRLARACNNLNYNPLIGIPSLAAIDALKTDPNANKSGLVFGPNVFPWMENGTPAEQAFQTAYAKYAPGTPTDASAATAWASGQMLAAVVNSLGAPARNAPITTAMILQGLGNIKNETLGGLVPPMTYTLNEAHATPVQCAYAATLGNQTWTPSNGGQMECL